jgi:hypothetical protein
MAGNRHDFTAKTVDVLRKRVGFLCSNPNCRKHTVGPNSDKEKATIVGVAAHIAAASPGGPRYNAFMNEKERKSIENGIWLCVNCSTLIDKDPIAFPTELLQSWKDETENEMSDQLRGVVSKSSKEEKLAFLEADLIWTSNMRLNRGYSERNRDIYGDKPVLVGSPMIIHWELRWELSLVIYNSSNYPAYNVQVIPHQQILKFEPLPKLNNIPALANIDIQANYSESFEGTSAEADEILKQRMPKTIIGSTYEVTYTDDTRKEHKVIFEIIENGVKNKMV